MTTDQRGPHPLLPAPCRNHPVHYVITEKEDHTLGMFASASPSEEATLDTRSSFKQEAIFAKDTTE